MQTDFSGTIYVKNAPEFRFEDGMFHVCHTTGTMHIALVMRPATFLKALRAADNLAEKFRARGGAVGIKDHAAKP